MLLIPISPDDAKSQLSQEYSSQFAIWYDRWELSKVTGMRGSCLSGSVRYALLGPLSGVSGGACPAEVSSLRLLTFDMDGFKNRNEE